MTTESRGVHRLRFSRRVGLVLCASMAAGCVATSRSEAPVSIFFLRHAEKAANDKTDPDLSDAGRARAESLATLLEHAGVTRLFATELKRTQQTLAPLAAKCGRTVEIIPQDSFHQQVTALLDLPPGSVAVVAGHNNTIPAIARAVGGTVDDVAPGSNGDVLTDYGRLILVVRPSRDVATHRATRTLRLQFGDAWSPSPPAR